MKAEEFDGRVVFVTGGASGIGFSIVEGFAAQGAKVALIDSNAEKGEMAAENLRSKNLACTFFQADVAAEADVARAAQAVAEIFGTVDHLVNNAGMVLVKPIEESSEADWDRVMGVNVKSIFLTVKHLLPALRKSISPTIVNIGSVSSFVGQKHTPIYVASKGATAMLSKSLALDLAAYGIRVNCVCPGITDTPMLRQHLNQMADPELTLRNRCDRVPLGRMLSPNEIASAVLFLSSGASSGITGTTLLVDAGYLAAAEWSNV